MTFFEALAKIVTGEPERASADLVIGHLTRVLKTATPEKVAELRSALLVIQTEKESD